MYDLIIIGAGPAGMSAALYACRANKKVLLLEAKSYGGQIINAAKVENYPGIKSISGFDYATTLYNQIIDLGAEIKYEMVTKITEDKTVFTNSTSYKAKAIIIATGSQNRKLGLSNENNFIGSGVSYCAYCDGGFYKNKIVAVIGGGNTAFTDAIYMSDIASKVYLIHRNDNFKADKKYIDEINNKSNIELIKNTNVIKLEGNDKIESIEILDNNNTKSIIKIDGIFIAIGQEPNNRIFSAIINIDDKGYIISEDGIHTNIDGIYVAGDARVKKLRQLVTAVSDGAEAATIALREMQ